MTSVLAEKNDSFSDLPYLLADAHKHLAQLDKPTGERTVTARNYDSAIRAFSDYLNSTGRSVPDKRTIEGWRDDMLSGRILNSRGKMFSPASVKARLSAVRKLLRDVADNTPDMSIKMALRDWANVSDPKKKPAQDKIEKDYGLRLSLQEAQRLIDGFDTAHLKGLRDRAIASLCLGAGLRIQEVVNLTFSDVFDTKNENGDRGIYVRDSKHGKSRVVVVSGWNDWVLQAVRAYTNHLNATESGEKIFRGVRKLKNGYKSEGGSLSKRSAQTVFDGLKITPHDLRRTFAKLCRQNGMEWEALREQMGHSSLKVTEEYVGKEVDWEKRKANWSIRLDSVA